MGYLDIYKDCLLHKKETNINLTDKGIFEPTILISMYETAGIGLEVLGIRKFDQKLAIYYRQKIDEFYKICTKMEISEEDYKEFVTKLKKELFLRNTQDLALMELTIEEFMHSENYNPTDEEIIKRNQIHVNWELGCFMISTDAFTSKMR